MVTKIKNKTYQKVDKPDFGVIYIFVFYFVAEIEVIHFMLHGTFF